MAFGGAVTGTATSTSDTSVTSGSFSPAAGSTLLAFLFTRNEQSNNATASGGGLTWTHIEETPASGTGSDGHTQVLRAHAASAPGSMTVQASYDTGSKAALVVVHYTDGDATTPTDAAASNRNTGNTKTMQGNITTSNDGSLDVSGLGAGTPWSDSDQPASFTHRALANTGGLTSEIASMSVADHEVASAGTDNHTWSSEFFHPDNALVAIEVLQSAGGGGGSPVPRRSLGLLGVGR